MTAALNEQTLNDAVKLHVFGRAAATGHVTQPAEIALALNQALLARVGLTGGFWHLRKF